MSDGHAEGPDLGRLHRLLNDADANTRAIYGPLNALAYAIVRAATDTQQGLATVFGFTLQSRPSEPQILMFFEFLYFFSHVTLRTVMARGFSESQLETVQAFLGPLLASTAVDSFFKHWPNDLKAKMRGDFFEKLNDAELDYSECRGLVSADNPVDERTLVGKVAEVVADIWERSADEVAKTKVALAVTQSFKTMGVDERVDAVKPVIDSVDADLLNKFWTEHGGA